MTSAREIFIDKQQEDELTSSSTIAARLGEETTRVETSTQFESSSKTRLTSAQRTIPERDFVLIITLVSGTLLAIAMALSIALILKVRKIKRVKRVHDEEMRRVKQSFENRLSSMTVVATADDSSSPAKSAVDSNVNIIDNNIVAAALYQNARKSETTAAYYNMNVDDLDDDDEDELNRSMRF